VRAAGAPLRAPTMGDFFTASQDEYRARVIHLPASRREDWF
jgi:hypothetical protein